VIACEGGHSGFIKGVIVKALLLW